MIKFKIGLAFVIIGFLICMFPYLFMLGIPFFIIGVALIWFSKKKLIVKIWSTVLPILVGCPAIFLFYFIGTRHVTPATYLIPIGFRGKVQIFYGEPCGIKIVKKNGRNIFRIPKNGIMIVSNPLETGIIDNEYYFANSKGEPELQIITLNKQDFNEDYTMEKNKYEPLRNKVGLFFGGTGTGGLEDGHSIKFEFFYVLAWNSLRAYKADKVDSIAEKQLKECQK